jgi:hypothetical protein
MKLSLLFERLLGEEFLEEDSVAEIKATHYSDIDDDVFKDIVSIDPKTKIKDGEVVYIGPYSKILLPMYREGNLKKEDSAKFTEYLEIAYANNLQLNKNLKSIGDLYELVKPYMKLSVDDTDVSKLMEYLDDSQYEMVHGKENGDEWYIFIPNNDKAACVLGSGTEWCTTWGPDSTNPKHKDRDNRFDYYNQQDSMYIIINKRDNSDKYQFHVPSRQFMDKGDNQVDLNRFFKNKEEVFLYFNPEFEDLSAYSSDKLMEFVVKPLIDNDHKDILIEKIVELNSDNEIIKLFKDSVAEAEDDFDSLNEILSNDFQIEEHFYSGYLKFEELKDRDLETYNNIGGYYGHSNNIYVEGDDVNYYINNSWDEIIKEVKNNFISYFKSEGHDIMGYLHHNGVRFDSNFLESLLAGSEKLESFYSDVHDLIYSAEDDAQTQSEDEIKNKVDGVFDINANEINTNVFLLFLLKSEEYTMESFKEFLSNTFDIIVDSDKIWDTINDLRSQYMNVDVKKIVQSFYDKFEDMCEWYLGYEDDDIRRYELKKNPDSSEYYNNTDDQHVTDAVLKLIDKIEEIVYKNTRKYDLYMSDDNRSLQIFTRKINPSNQTVGIRFFNNIKKKKFDGYVKIDDLPRYINFNNAPNFFKRINDIFRGLKLSSNRDNFENELVKLKLDYNNVDVDKGLIYAELTNKSNNHTDKGMINIESIPTYYTNTKLFEELNRFKKLI